MAWSLAARPRFDRGALPLSVLHLGPGAFFRAHIASYFDDLNAHDPRWGIRAIALRSRQVPDAMTAQDGLCTLVELGVQSSAHILGSIKEVLFLGDIEPDTPFLEPDLSLITLTITEKGYCLDRQGNLDLDHPDVQKDLAEPSLPTSAIGLIVNGLRARKAVGLPPPIILSCDNLPDNGGKLRRAIIRLATEQDPMLGQWIEENILCPESMVDSITPVSDAALDRMVSDMTGKRDMAAVQRETFKSWVIRRPDQGQRMPPLDTVGAVYTNDVGAHEQAKLRMLNGAHSVLAYVGLARGFATVSEAMGDPDMHRFIDELMSQEIAPALTAPDGLNLDDYRGDLIARFENPAIAHRLSQIAWDGSKKLPIRLLSTLSENLSAGRPIGRLALGVTAWMAFIARMAKAGEDIVDPLSDQLAAIGLAKDRDHTESIRHFLDLREVFSIQLSADQRFTAALFGAADDLPWD